VSGFRGKVAVVTGAGSGLGRALACGLAERGAAVAVSDIDARGLAETAAMVRTAGARVLCAQVDVSDRTAVHAHADAVHAAFGIVHQVYNNAGTAYVGPFEQVEYAAFERVMAVNFWGVVHGIKAFLPHLVESGDGHVVNIASVFGLAASPWMSGYDASKFAVRGLSEALRAELRAARRPVRVTCVEPGGLRTSIVENAGAAPGEDLAEVQRRFDKVARTTPEEAARVILRGVQRGRGRVLVGPDARLADAGRRVCGSGYERIGALAARWFVPSRNK
jgi:NAD(P)-dependent dehydrogenase (short-subunit alcohol dehydrogenase family)